MASDQRAHLIVLAAGRGSRVGASTPKQFARVAGETTLLECAIDRAVSARSWETRVVVAPASHIGRTGDVLSRVGATNFDVVAGGADRMESLMNAMAAIEGAPSDLCVVHDGVRPFTPPELFNKVVLALKDDKVDACWPASPTRDTIVHRPADARPEVLPAREVHIAATPIAVRWEVLLQALAAKTQMTGILIDRLLRVGARCTHVENSWWNYKVTTRQDLDLTVSLKKFGGGGGI